MKKFKVKLPKALVSVPLALWSLKVFFGGVFGYLLAQFLSSKINSVVLNLGNLKFHFHHWIMGVLVLGAILAYEISPLMNELSYGVLSGVIFQGISSYPDWNKIFFKKK